MKQVSRGNLDVETNDVRSVVAHFDLCFRAAPYDRLGERSRRQCRKPLLIAPIEEPQVEGPELHALTSRRTDALVHELC